MTMQKIVLGSYFVGSVIATITLSSGLTLLARLAPIIRNQLLLIAVVVVTIAFLFCFVSPKREALIKMLFIVVFLIGIGVIVGCT